jgi:hypothetical protein
MTHRHIGTPNRHSGSEPAPPRAPMPFGRVTTELEGVVRWCRSVVPFGAATARTPEPLDPVGALANGSRRRSPTAGGVRQVRDVDSVRVLRYQADLFGTSSARSGTPAPSSGPSATSPWCGSSSPRTAHPFSGTGRDRRRGHHPVPLQRILGFGRKCSVCPAMAVSTGKTASKRAGSLPKVVVVRGSAAAGGRPSPLPLQVYPAVMAHLTGGPDGDDSG